ncbi:hypothetical protein BFP76_02015 [Amylibacter kogurei]|uniref:Uncharacterized protein n=1 Tax=Paramylibacter kogurei TaxID=1889778 RepID=A0A2G5K3D5_9RHOB|nr:DUF3578 domain-containing protein [Amylibacter kogurei]PIB24046.1 hypothetical protein BFP76_02015 [Amylibacter kogurei]
MSISKGLAKLTSEYETQSTSPIKDNPFAQFVTNELSAIFQDILPTEFNCVSSVGKGRWTFVPWVAVFHPLITESAQKGYYIVYLVNNADKTISLSLNQGVAQITEEFGNNKSACQELASRAKTMRSRVERIPPRLTQSSIDLGDAKGPTSGYEAGHVLGRTYTLDDLANNNTVEEDLFAILGVYKELITSNGYSELPNKEETGIELSIMEKKKLSLHKKFDGRGNTSKFKKSMGYKCMVCEFDFEETYGELGREYIEAHHLTPFADLEIDAFRTLTEKDFAMLCANCHRMIHRQDDVSDLEALKLSLQR